MQLSHLRNYIDRKRNGHQDTIHHTWSHIQQNNYRHIPALKANDINCAEITFRTACAAQVCKEKGIPYYPGCVTPTEIIQALELGITTVKFFPANVYGGLTALKALAAPFPQIKFIPTGGVDRSNIDEFLAFDKVAAIGGSFFVKEALEKYNAQ